MKLYSGFKDMKIIVISTLVLEIIFSSLIAYLNQTKKNHTKFLKSKEKGKEDMK